MFNKKNCNYAYYSIRKLWQTFPFNYSILFGNNLFDIPTSQNIYTENENIFKLLPNKMCVLLLLSYHIHFTCIHTHTHIHTKHCTEQYVNWKMIWSAFIYCLDRYTFVCDGVSTALTAICISYFIFCIGQNLNWAMLIRLTLCTADSYKYEKEVVFRTEPITRMDLLARKRKGTSCKWTHTREC